MAFDTTQITGLLDPVWEQAVQETDEFSSALWESLSSMPEGDSNLVGRKIKVRTGYNESESYASFGSASGYAQGGNTTFTTFLVPYRTVSTQVLIDQEAIDNDGAQSQYHPVVEELASAMQAGYKKLNRACLMGDGLGTIGILTANYAGGTPTLVTTAPGTGFGNKGAQFIKPTKKVQIYNSTGATLRNGTIGGEGIVTVSSRLLSRPVLSR
jgi:hypothetical protein